MNDRRDYEIETLYGVCINEDYDLKIEKLFAIEDKIANREKIKLLELTTEDQINKLVNYVWKGEYLIPAEMIEGE